MDIYLLDWANLLLRWLHVITVIAWIGASFYFVWLDNHLLKPTAEDLKAKGVDGELWAVHGGGFYNPQKYMVAPANLPKDLHWFYWESYWTWMSGFALFVVLYLCNPSQMLIDTRVHEWGAPWHAVLAAIGFLFGGAAAYDIACQTLGRTKDGGIGNDGRVMAVVVVVVIFASWLACHLFAGRAAFLIVGAMLATMMTANVAHWIIPGQKKVIAQMRAGQKPDPIHGQRGKQRSVHNTYFGLPVLIAMLSNHYGMLTQHAHNWMVLCVLMAAGVAIRIFFVKRHKGVNSWGSVALALALLAGLIVWMAPKPQPAVAAVAPVTLEQVQAIATQRCLMCHTGDVAQKGVRLDTAETLTAHKAQIHQQVAVQRLMPLNNATAMTEEERALMARWALQK
ncbi:urate hydroxylase PuuD [Roseateles asaccharophilus]|uniref:Membrane protein n=1 Tax=Roseateles asaccharophilus TaxID=582607 RepID=A0ABU2A8J3_9BURK|nr:urate hydroxylase PuuD [Roseateles asaccharophilus]MDR7333518.1 putative membrane protein [Roseateles asaccharophilus]